MKKNLAVVALAAVLTTSMVAPAAVRADAATESAEVVELTYEDIDDDYFDAGTWLSTVYGFDIMLPSEWNVPEITDEMTEQNIVFAAMDAETEDASKYAALIQTFDSNGADLSELYEGFAANEDLQDVQQLLINGLDAIYFDTDNSASMVFQGVSGTLYSISFAINEEAGADLEEGAALALNMFKSISPSETESGAESAVEGVEE